MPDETAVVEPPISPEPQVDPADEVRGLLFGTEEERAEIQAKFQEELAAKEAEEKAAAEAAAPKPVPKPKPAVKPTAPKPKPAVQPEEVDPEPEPEPTKPKPPKKLSTEEMIRLNAEGTREAVVAGVREAVEQTQRRAQPEPEPLPSADNAALPPVIKKNLAALRILAEQRPNEFRAIDTKAIKFWDEKTGDLAKYRKAWQKEHPGDEFDMDDEEHEIWMKENEPFVSEEDLESAREEVMRRRLRAEVRQEIEPLRRQVAERQAEEQSFPVINRTVNTTLKDIVVSLNPELKDLSDEDLAANKLQEKDPVAAHVLVRTAPSFIPLISETVRIFAGKPYDGNNQVHAHLDRYAGQLEQNIAAMPAEQTAISGPNGPMRFATRSQMARLNPADKAKYWTVDQEVIIQSLRKDWANATRASYQEYRALMDTFTGKKPSVPNTKPAAKPVPVQEAELESDEEPTPARSPSVRSSSPAPPPIPKDDPSLSKPGTAFFERAGW